MRISLLWWEKVPKIGLFRLMDITSALIGEFRPLLEWLELVGRGGDLRPLGVASGGVGMRCFWGKIPNVQSWPYRVCFLWDVSSKLQLFSYTRAHSCIKIRTREESFYENCGVIWVGFEHDSGFVLYSFPCLEDGVFGL